MESESETIKWKALWLGLSFALVIIWSFLAFHFLERVISAGVWLLILFVILPSCLAIYEFLEKGQKSFQVAFLVVLVGSGIFLGSTQVGLVEAVSLEGDSSIDVSNSVISLHVRNTGLSDVKITGVTVGNASFNFKSHVQLFLPIRMEKYLHIHYGRQIIDLGTTSDPFGWRVGTSRYEYAYTSDTDVTPRTFTNGSTYPVVFHTSGVLSHSFSLRAEATSEEELVIWDYHAHKETARVYLFFKFNNSVASQRCHIYNMQIGDVTFRLEPAYPVVQTKAFQEIFLDISDSHEEGFSCGIYGIGHLSYEMKAEPKPTVTMYEQNQTCKVTIWTMANNHYSFNIFISASFNIFISAR